MREILRGKLNNHKCASGCHQPCSEVVHTTKFILTRDVGYGCYLRNSSSACIDCSDSKASFILSVEEIAAITVLDIYKPTEIA